MENRMKAIISDRIYLKLEDREQARDVIKALTYKFTKTLGSGKSAQHLVDTVISYRKLPGNIYSLPQGRQDLIPAGYEIDDRRVLNPVPFPEPKSELFPEQQVVYDQVEDTCFINALPGWGKTFTALHIAKKLGQKTLVVVHTTALRDQWIKEVEILYGVQPGVIGSSKYDVEDHFIVIGNIQSLVKHKKELAKEFGTVILDEAHHCPATTFTAFMDAMQARYRIALSGTMERKDGRHKLFPDYFGKLRYTPPPNNTLPPTVALVKPGFTLKPGASWVDKINDLLSDDNYIRFISALALAQMEAGHQVLVIADRVEFLKKITEYVGEDCLFVAGEVGFEDREKAKELLLSREKMCIAGSRQIFSEGISINTLSCVILAIPINNDANLEQIIGRVMRISDEKKKSPVVVDIQFSGREDRKQNDSRLSLYLRKGWKMVSI